MPITIAARHRIIVWGEQETNTCCPSTPTSILEFRIYTEVGKENNINTSTHLVDQTKFYRLGHCMGHSLSKMLFFTTALVALLPLALAAPATKPLVKRAPLHPARSGKVIPGQYIVKFKDGAVDTVLSATVGKLKTTAVFKGPFKGFAGSLDAASLEAIRKLPEVEFVEEDSVITLKDDLIIPGTSTGSAPRAIITQTGAPWNLARLANHPPGSTVYRYDNTAGAGTCAYVLATGILISHVVCAHSFLCTASDNLVCYYS